jgi:hypothetical protein
MRIRDHFVGELSRVVRKRDGAELTGERAGRVFNNGDPYSDTARATHVDFV